MARFHLFEIRKSHAMMSYIASDDHALFKMNQVIPGKPDHILIEKYIPAASESNLTRVPQGKSFKLLFYQLSNDHVHNDYKQVNPM